MTFFLVCKIANLAMAQTYGNPGGMFTMTPFSFLPGLPNFYTMARLAILQTKKNVIRVDFMLEFKT
jgi:hypothetical protein